jgi:hypothetical protein
MECIQLVFCLQLAARSRLLIAVLNYSFVQLTARVVLAVHALHA